MMDMAKDAAGGAIPETVGQLARIADALEELVECVQEEKGKSLHTPLKEKGEATTTTECARARTRVKPPTIPVADNFVQSPAASPHLVLILTVYKLREWFRAVHKYFFA